MESTLSRPPQTDKPPRGGSPELQRERATATRAALVAAARAIFARSGFHDARAVDIAKAASVTRGALYHHFADKEALFEEVCHAVADELNRLTAASVAGLPDDLWAKICGAFDKYLELVASQGEYQRILLIDGPAVLGWQRWRELQSEHVAKGTAEALRMLMDRNLIAPRPAEPLANLIQAALNDAALSLAHPAATGKAAEAETRDAFLFLLERIRG